MRVTEIPIVCYATFLALTISKRSKNVQNLIKSSIAFWPYAGFSQSSHSFFVPLEFASGLSSIYPISVDCDINLIKLKNGKK